MGVIESRFVDMIWEREPITAAELAKLSEQTLKWKKTYRNVRYRGGKLPPYTNYVYTYQVGEREYRYRGSGNHTKRGLYQKAAMVYVKGFPRRAYPNKFTGFMEWMWGIFGIVMAAIFGAILILAETGAIPK